MGEYTKGESWKRQRLGRLKDHYSGLIWMLTRALTLRQKKFFEPFFWRLFVNIPNLERFVSRYRPAYTAQHFHQNQILNIIYHENCKILSQTQVFCTNSHFDPNFYDMQLPHRLIYIPSRLDSVKYLLTCSQIKLHWMLPICLHPLNTPFGDQGKHT